MREAAKLVVDLVERGEAGGEYGPDFSRAIDELRRSLDQNYTDNVVIVRWQGHEIVYALEADNFGTGEFEGRVPAWAKAMGILHALRHILEVKELESILSVCCARMRELYRLRASQLHSQAPQGGIDRG